MHSVPRTHSKHMPRHIKLHSESYWGLDNAHKLNINFLILHTVVRLGSQDCRLNVIGLSPPSLSKVLQCVARRFQLGVVFNAEDTLFLCCVEGDEIFSFSSFEKTGFFFIDGQGLERVLQQIRGINCEIG